MIGVETMRRTVHVRNTTRQTDIAHHARVADTFWTRLRGLIGREPLAPGEGLVIVPCKGVHMWFMRFPIDVIYVGEGDRVVDVDENLQPWAIGRPRRESRYVIEVPAGMVAATGTRPGDRLVLEEL